MAPRLWPPPRSSWCFGRRGWVRSLETALAATEVAAAVNIAVIIADVNTPENWRVTILDTSSYRVTCDLCPDVVSVLLRRE